MKQTTVSFYASSSSSLSSSSSDPCYLHFKDPNLWNAPSANPTKIHLLFCTHSFSWSSATTGSACFVKDSNHELKLSGKVNPDVFPRGTTWDVAVSRITGSLSLPRIGILESFPSLSLFAYDGAGSFLFSSFFFLLSSFFFYFFCFFFLLKRGQEKSKIEQHGFLKNETVEEEWKRAIFYELTKVWKDNERILSGKSFVCFDHHSYGQVEKLQNLPFRSQFRILIHKYIESWPLSSLKNLRGWFSSKCMSGIYITIIVWKANSLAQTSWKFALREGVKQSSFPLLTNGFRFVS